MQDEPRTLDAMLWSPFPSEFRGALYSADKMEWHSPSTLELYFSPHQYDTGRGHSHYVLSFREPPLDPRHGFGPTIGYHIFLYERACFIRPWYNHWSDEPLQMEFEAVAGQLTGSAKELSQAIEEFGLMTNQGCRENDAVLLLSPLPFPTRRTREELYDVLKKYVSPTLPSPAR